MSKIKLDAADKKILYELDLNSRQPVSSIAKKTRLSRDIVSYRIKKFEEEKTILKHHAVIDIARLGFAAHKQFIRFRNLTPKKEKDFEKFLTQSPYVIYAAGYDGVFDAVVSIWAKSIEELAEHLKDIELQFGNVIAERQMASIIYGEYTARNYLIEKRPFPLKKFFFGSTPIPVALDDFNKKILLELSADARISSVEIAGLLRISPDAICQRIRKLEKLGIIQRYNIVPNEETYPYLHYKILFSLHLLNKEQEKKLKQYCRMHRNIWYFCNTLGPWQFEMDVDAMSHEEFRAILREIKLEFADIIKGYSVLSAFKTFKYNFFPSMF